MLTFIGQSILTNRPASWIIVLRDVRGGRGRDKGRAPQPSFSNRVENILRVIFDSGMPLLKGEITPFNRAAALLLQFAIRVQSANFANFCLPSSFSRHFGDSSVHVTFTGREFWNLNKFAELLVQELWFRIWFRWKFFSSAKFYFCRCQGSVVRSNEMGI